MLPAPGLVEVEPLDLAERGHIGNTAQNPRTESVGAGDACLECLAEVVETVVEDGDGGPDERGLGPGVSLFVAGHGRQHCLEAAEGVVGRSAVVQQCVRPGHRQLQAWPHRAGGRR